MKIFDQVCGGKANTPKLFLMAFTKHFIMYLFAGTESLFNKINCDRSTIDDMLADQQGVSDQNMLQYLGIVEERTNLLLLTQAYIESQKVKLQISYILQCSFITPFCQRTFFNLNLDPFLGTG